MSDENGGGMRITQPPEERKAVAAPCLALRAGEYLRQHRQAIQEELEGASGKASPQQGAPQSTESRIVG